MSKAELFDFTVESYNTDPAGRAQQTSTHKVSATSAEGAAAKALHEQLFQIGNVTRLRARVWRIGEDGARIETALYLKS